MSSNCWVKKEALRKSKEWYKRLNNFIDGAMGDQSMRDDEVIVRRCNVRGGGSSPYSSIEVGDLSHVYPFRSNPRGSINNIYKKYGMGEIGIIF